jgi:F0F1-type ATP synthase assembly protein I
MSTTLFIGSISLITIWAIAFIGFHIGGLIHVLPVVAFIAIVARLIYNRYLMNNKPENNETN